MIKLARAYKKARRIRYEELMRNELKIIRESEHLLETKGSPCAFFSHPEEVNCLARKVKAYRTCV